MLSLGTVTSSTVNLGDGVNVLTTGDVSYGTLIAGAGKNTITLGTATAQATGGAGSDTISGFEICIGSIYDDYLQGSTGSDTLYGGDGNDTLNGLAGADIMYGGAGNDIMGTGSAATADTMYGGTGDDFYYANNAGDLHYENASEGTDTIQAGHSWTLGSNFENLIVGGSSAINGTGNSLNNTLDGSTNSAVNTLSGLGGDDTYIVGTGDVVVESASSGTDTVFSAVTYTITDTDVENLTLTGSSNVNLTGNASANVLTGNSGNNVFGGGDGNDIEYGGAGTDTLQGGNGDDTLYGQDGLDTLWGGADADMFVFEAASAYNNVDVIKDFSTVANDKIDLRDLLGEYDPLTEALTDFVEITTSGSDSVLKVDRDGTGGTYSLVQIATIEGVTGLTDEAALVTSGHLLAA